MTRTRLGWVDGLRGLAIVLMVLDHVLVQVDPTSLLRYTVTRAALPLFMFAAATVWHGGYTLRRWGVLLWAVLAELGLFSALGMPGPGILAIYALVAFLVQVVPQIALRPAVWASVGLVQALYLPLPLGAYQPGLVLAWFLLGRLGAGEVSGLGERCRWLAPIGRHPLAWYVGHLSAIALVMHLLA